MNRIIELHDSEVAEIWQDAADLVVTFSAAYVHESEGDAGLDPGEVYLQRADLRITNAHSNEPLLSSPARIADGTLICGDEVSPNFLPVPLAFRGTASLVLTVWASDFSSTIDVRGDGVTLALIGEPTYLQHFPGKDDSTPPN